MVEATDSSNATASTQGVRAGTAHKVYNTRTPDVPMEHYCSSEAIVEGIQAEAEWVTEQAARSTATTPTTTTPTTDNDNSGEGLDKLDDDGIRDGGPCRDRDQDNDPQAPMEAIMHNNRMLHRWGQHPAYYNNQANIANLPASLSEEQKHEFDTRLGAMHEN